ncbi:hypothetical protein [Pseudomonas defluvii]|uniref:hypothetical protein n=1 Tax=Pseudomonas defluvii TaxID=1876757 RepID=UPI0039067B82
MSFELVAPQENYAASLDFYNKGGNCMGISSLWVRELFRRNTSSLAEPNVIEGRGLQARYGFFSKGAKCVQDADVAFWSEQASLLCNFGVKKIIARDYSSSVALVNSLPEKFSNTAILTGWQYSDKQSCLDRFGFYRPSAQGGHVVALFKLKGAGEIYMYDANFGVHKWHPTSGVSLKTDMKRYMIEAGYGLIAKMDVAMMLSTNNDIPADKKPVDFSAFRYD